MSHEYVADFYRPARCVNCGERREHAIHSTGEQHMTTTPEQIEAVARAMWMADVEPYDPADRIPFEEAPETARAYCLAEAIAAINAMRPFIRTEVLEEAAKVADSYEPRCDICPSGVTAAIRALKEKP